MEWWQPVERLRGRKRSSWVFDGLLALVVAAPGLATVAQDLLPWPVGVAGLVVTVGLLVVRRIVPFPAFLGLWVVSAVFGLIDIRSAAQIALLLAIATVATCSPRRQLVVAVALLELGVVVTALRLDAGTWWLTVILLSGMVAAAVGIGLYRGARQAYLQQLQDRADRLERERDQQAVIASAAERARIAREMHDIVAHHLTVMVALSDGAVAASAKSPERAAEVMRTVSATGRQALSDTRRLLGVLRDDDAGGDERRPLPDLSDLDDLVHRVRDAGLPVRYEVHGATPEVPPAVQLTVYRLVQEALTNTMKHAGRGASATVSLHYAPDEVSVHVRDDGGTTSGVSGPANGAGRGLAGMRERVTAFGGEVWTGPADGRGWRVSATMRLQELGS